jgi:peptide/nickel transport system substrate-binding protein
MPAEPLVVVPYESIGRYGGTLNALSNATEAGTSDFLSVRHVNLVRYADDLQTIVPNVAKSWSWNDDFTELTMELREGHKWSDGAPFTSYDIEFWLKNLALDPNVIEKPKDYVLAAGEPIDIETMDDTTFKFVLPSPKPGLLVHFATSYAQAFQPKHFLGQFHPDIDPNADANAQKYGFENGYEAIAAYYGSSDWTDTPTPMLRMPDSYQDCPRRPSRRWRATSTSTTPPRAASWSPTPISTWSTRPASSCPTSRGRTSSTPTTTRCASSSS